MAKKNKVIIVGAGPVGLTCALSLGQQGIPVLVLEAHPELFMDLRAGSFHPPTLEALEQIGITSELMATGIQVDRWQFRDRSDGVVGTFELSLLKGETSYPFRLHLEQHRYTPIVYQKLALLPHVEVRFACKVMRAGQSADAVSVTADTPDGRETFEGTWLIGADGGGSIVRKSAGISLTGFTYPERFALISTRYDLGQHGFTDTAYISHPVEWCAVFRLPDDGPPGMWRFLYGCHPDETEAEALSDEVVEERLQAVVPKAGRYETKHRTIYPVHQRVADTFRHGRMLLAGDAAHLNNPIGGFGLNSGLQDAINLTSKLGALHRKDTDENALDLYVRQRRTVTIEHIQDSSIRNKRILEETDPAVRKTRIEEMRCAANNPALAKQILMRSSMIESMKRANTIT